MTGRRLAVQDLAVPCPGPGLGRWRGGRRLTVEMMEWKGKENENETLLRGGTDGLPRLKALSSPGPSDSEPGRAGHKRKRGNYTHGKSLDSRGWREKGKERADEREQWIDAVEMGVELGMRKAEQTDSSSRGNGSNNID
ncbi:hypothetical protein An07g05340 [Aspergillus niger]|uniref:Uncharacterized protein n=2 Tax=Aspergillus niger TaxID=5061 RepID=A2QNE1_ASPNC|nr:hypothetical protein An07g05340 [Aspergillus niger]CAK39450.1 hypothetical protein An07g05340 [Aspergillus niger]